MALLCDRIEKQDEVVVIYKYEAAWYLILLTFFISIPFTQGMEALMVGLLFLVFFIQIVGKSKTNREIKQAMRNGKVQ
ncbi:MAG: hypothetical protein HOE80_02145, partial [Candidatus Magasanikbacteria bacterium]|nr:hypothetical protein [Candidatus Magasanikbacteria bacterium]